MIYLVSGYLRSGTSMMMRALSEGGLTPIEVDEVRDSYMNLNISDPDYLPNPHGFYETTQVTFLDFAAAPEKYDGGLIKVLRPALKRVKFAPGAFKTIFMTRDPVEIEMSLKRTYAWFTPAMANNVDDYERLSDWAIRYLEAQTGDVHAFDYKEVVREPERIFRQLASAGWPIDVKKAVAVIDEKMYRNRALE